MYASIFILLNIEIRLYKQKHTTFFKYGIHTAFRLANSRINQQIHKDKLLIKRQTIESRKINFDSCY